MDHIYREVVLCKIPIMVHSSYCYLAQRPGDMSSCIYDSGGYFIINGLEKTLIAQQKLRTNTSFVWPGRRPSRAKLVCEVRSCHERKMRSTSTLFLELIPDASGAPAHIAVQLPFLTRTVPLTSLFKMLGCGRIEDMVTVCSEDDADIVRLAHFILRNDEQSIGGEVASGERLVEWIGAEATTETAHEKQQRYVTHILGCELLPHMGLGNSAEVHRGKVMYLGHMVHRLLLVHLGRRSLDDRDHFANKRVDATGHLMSLLFRQLFRAHLKTMHSQLQRALEAPHKQLNIPKLALGRKITAGFKFAFATGNWGVQARMNTAQSGVAQVLNRNSIFSSLADKRRVALQAKRESKNPRIRQLHTSAWGVICPCESPEGASCGLIVNLAALAHVRIHACEQSTVHKIMLQLPAEMDFQEVAPAQQPGAPPGRSRARVMHNGYIHGTVAAASAAATCDELRRLRAGNVLPFDASVSMDADAAEIHLSTDAGCLCRPVFVASEIGRVVEAVRTCRERRAPLWPSLVIDGIIMYMDKEEEAHMRVAEDAHQALGGGYTHAEIHASAILGMGASMIPFANHNQAPRNTYQCAMGKQSIGCYASNALTRFDTFGYGLWYPQRPLVGTCMEDILGTKDIPAGTNAIVAIMCYGGYNQEDSLIYNMASLQRGMMRNTITRTMRDEVGGEGYAFGIPPEDCNNRRSENYAALRPDGTVPVGTRVRQGDAVIGKTRVSHSGAEGERCDDYSTVARCANEGTVDRVLSALNRDGQPLRKVRIRETRQPQEGDKFTSRHGQKGVIGARLAPEDMPFTADGMQPDVIMNPHAIPSRMTVGQLVEMLLATLCCATGHIGDGTSFGSIGVDDIARQLTELGLQPYGRHTMYNGTTGEPLEAEIFVAPVYLQSLKHMVDDKCHARKSGPVDPKTRQPVEGRKGNGGLRIGEMERDCMVAHGASALLGERLFTQSDPFRCHACSKCGLFAEGPCAVQRVRARTPFCRHCDSSEHVREIAMPYATKLFMQEVMGLNVAPLMQLRD